MYKYELLNNHYVVNIDGKKFLIDTGSNSFWVTSPMNYVSIDGVKYPLFPNRLDPEAQEKTFRLVGTTIDGFIGLDIISKTSLTIYADGNIDFKATNVAGATRVPFVTGPGLFINVSSNGVNGKMFIDTGAKYGYGIRELFYSETPYVRNEYDFNPHLRDMHSDIYNQKIIVGGQAKNIEVGFNQRTYGYPLGGDIVMIANISTFYDEVCVIDINKGELVFK